MITTTTEGVWELDQVYNKVNNGTYSYVGQNLLYVWGWNNQGQLGLNNVTYYSSPVQLGSVSDTPYSELIGEAMGARGIKTDGTLWAWGTNPHGQLGQNNTTSYSSPVQIGTETTWSTIAFGGEAGASSAGVKSDGTLWTWGWNQYGSLGHNNTTEYSSPKQIGTDTTWARGDFGDSNQALFVKTDGTLWTWGDNEYGQLGLNGSETSRKSSPTQIGTGTNWDSGASKVAVGNVFALAVRTDGTLWSWGYNNKGQLGQNSVSNYSSPVQVGTQNTWNTIVAHSYEVWSMKTDGTLWSWGENEDGDLGHNSEISYSSPVQVGISSDWNTLGIRIASKTDGTVWTWGENVSGELGQNNLTDYSSPVQISGVSWSPFISAGVQREHGVYAYYNGNDA